MLKTLNNIGAHVSAFVVGFGATMMTSAAFAGGSIDTVVTDATQSISNIPTLITTGSYIAGAASTGVGLLNLRKAVDDPSQNPLRKALGPLGAGVLLMALPSATGLIGDSISASGGTAVQYKNDLNITN